jgi:hypothetical protein
MVGQAAVAIWCDVALEVREEFDDWHAHEHVPERLAIPGFLRGSRWVAEQGEGNFMLYEAASEPVITAGPYLERLNHPTPWSRKMMPHHRNMVRGLCAVQASYGSVLGQALLTARFSADTGELRSTLAAMAQRKGLVAAALLRHIGQTSPQTTEQRLRGGEGAPDSIALVSGYSADALAQAAQELQGGAPGCVLGRYRLAYVLSATGYTGRPEETA